MVSPRGVVCGLVLLSVLSAAMSAVRKDYSNSWAVHVVGGPEVAERLAHKHGFVNQGQVCVCVY